ncbi:helicase domain protein [Nitzschia inconspicua]|uniref:Helicase domain protein n=1 Tax=Nitzschia inconspicua TaxID=303405 RepID=A0A9K3LCG7_9STRA|nr:helicase domain protein [Nitzschia inconspicua]
MIILVLLLVPVDGWCVTTTSRRIVTLWPETSTLTLPTTTRQHFHLLAGKSFTNEESKAKASTHKGESLREKSWEAMYQRLVKFRNDHGHTNVPMSFNDRDDQPHLGKWVSTQRYRKKRNDPPYSKIRAEKLDSIGFKWILNERDGLGETWESTYQRLLKYQKEYGHTIVPVSFNDGDEKPHLGRWVATQRSLKKRQDPPYSKIRADKLDSIGFVWTLTAEDRSQLFTKIRETKFEETWESMYQRLVKYQNEHGHTNVPVSFNDRDDQPHLGKWVATQRSRKKRNDPPYSKIRAEKLDSIGFKWILRKQDGLDETWESTYQRLLKYQKEYGHTNVPVSFNDGENEKPHLGKWVATQRYRKKRNDPPYSKIRAEKLDSIGFKWILNERDGLGETWESTYQRLLKYQTEYGHTNVPVSFNYGDEKPHLGRWVARQRSRKKRKDQPYSKIRAEKLDSIGFKWIIMEQDSFEKTWESTYQRLLKYQKEYGHTNVPISFNDRDEKPHLGKWVAMQRYRKNRNDPPYSKIRAEKLDSIGFNWILNE